LVRLMSSLANLIMTILVAMLSIRPEGRGVLPPPSGGVAAQGVQGPVLQKGGEAPPLTILLQCTTAKSLIFINSHTCTRSTVGSRLDLFANEPYNLNPSVRGHDADATRFFEAR
jgi:hypothetical protein